MQMPVFYHHRNYQVGVLLYTNVGLSKCGILCSGMGGADIISEKKKIAPLVIGLEMQGFSTGKFFKSFLNRKGLLQSACRSSTEAKGEWMGDSSCDSVKGNQ